MTRAAENDAEQVNILLVDDHPPNLKALEAVLANPEYNIAFARSGPDALREVLRTDFAVILLDVMMPGMDGFEVARIIKQRAATRSIPIIFISAVARDMKEIFRGYSAGAVDYVLKPLEPDIIRAKVAVFVDLYRKTKEIQRQAELIRNSERAQFLEREQAARRKAEEAEARFRTLVNALDHAVIWEADPDLSRMIFVSERAERLLGYPRERWLTEPNFFLNHIHPEDQILLFKTLDRLRHSAADDSFGERCDHRIIAADSSVRWFHTGIQDVRDTQGRLVALRGLSVDINSLKTVEMVLRESQDRLDLALDAAKMGIWDQNLITGSLVVSDTMKHLFGYAPGEGPRTVEESLSRIHPEDRDRVQQARGGAVQTGDGYEAEYRIVLPDGGLRWVLSRGRAYVDASGRPVRISGTVVDITERKEAQRERELLIQRLEAAVRTRDEMVAICAHDLKGPLAAISLNAGLLSKALRPLDDAKGRRALERIDRSSRQMKSIIDGLLDLARIEAGTFAVQKRPEQLLPLVEEALDILRPLAEAKQLRLEAHVDPQGLGVLCDRDRVLQVLANLVGNAIKFTPEEGLIRVLAGKRDTVAEISVQDSGIGIAPDALPHVFDRFWQAEKTKKEGAGLGLSIVKGIVEAHGEKIRAESEVGRGTTFFFTLPLSAAGEERTSPAAPLPPGE